MIDPKAFREDPKRFRAGAADKGVAIDFDRLTALDERRRAILTEMEAKKAEQNRLSKEVGPKMGQLKGKLKSAQGAEKDALEAELADLEKKPHALKAQVATMEQELATVEPAWRDLLMTVPQPPANDVPKGKGGEDNTELRRWNPAGFDASKSFESQRGFKPKTHLELVRDLPGSFRSGASRPITSRNRSAAAGTTCS
ncbi:MAG: hypothetical protein LW625_03900 [Planctomycetaceae bacterium]|nr:hypothetical protein [Planctomycetaceae bacterium]